MKTRILYHFHAPILESVWTNILELVYWNCVADKSIYYNEEQPQNPELQNHSILSHLFPFPLVSLLCLLAKCNITV